MPDTETPPTLTVEPGYQLAAVMRGAIRVLASTEDYEAHDQIMDAIRLLDIGLEQCDQLIDQIDAFTARHNEFQCSPRRREQA